MLMMITSLKQAWNGYEWLSSPHHQKSLTAPCTMNFFHIIFFFLINK